MKKAAMRLLFICPRINTDEHRLRLQLRSNQSVFICVHLWLTTFRSTGILFVKFRVFRGHTQFLVAYRLK